ncbi:polyketide synthase [Kitasatospora sp. NPDC088134]|uniref:polyketide synthase n=1 Tax=Kitasatospora sp. NPDC088134 TaxID=3364071 RepID=UPI0038269CAD
MSDDDPFTVDREGGVALVTLHDPARRNRLTPTVLHRFPALLERTALDPAVRVVVLAGLPDVFCAGGDRDYLLRLATGERSALESEPCVRAPLRCPVPVVAAMQGHAVGGGLLLGLFCDLAVFSERSVYHANFLQYGFIPCMGATVLLPARLGDVLGPEMLLTARGYRGAELRERGAGLRVTAHREVLPTALAEARRMARAPRAALELMKKRLAAPLHAATEAAIPEELALMRQCFTDPAVRHRIQRLYPEGETK